MKPVGIRRGLRVLLGWVALAMLVLVGLGVLGTWGPDVWGWVQVGFRDPSMFEQLAEKQRRVGGPASWPGEGHSFQDGDFLRLAASLKTEDGKIAGTGAYVFVADSAEYRVDDRTIDAHVEIHWPAIVGAVVIFVLMLTRATGAGRAGGGRTRSRVWTILLRVIAAGILLSATLSLSSLLGIGTTGGVSLNAERLNDKLYERPEGVGQDEITDVRLHWGVQDGGLWIDGSVVRWFGGHMSVVPSEVAVKFQTLPRVERSFDYLGSGFITSGVTLECGGWLPVGLAIVILGVAGRRWIERRRRVRGGRCVPCGYDLRGNTTGVCPECGAATERGTDGTFRTQAM